MATGDLTNVANVRQWLNLSANTDDALLQRLVTACSLYIQTWLNRSLVSQSYTERRDGNGKARFFFSDYPVTAVSSVVVDGLTIPASPDGIQPGYTFSDRFIYLIGYVFSKGQQNVVLQYTAGYTTIPPELEQACVEVCSLRYRERERIGHASKSIQGETVAFTIVDFPKQTQTILNNYKKVISVL